MLKPLIRRYSRPAGRDL